MDIPRYPFNLFISSSGRVLGAAPLDGETWSPHLAPNFFDTGLGLRIMVVAVTTSPATLAQWTEIVDLATTWEEAGEMATAAWGGVAWPTLPLRGMDGGVLPYVHPGTPGEA